MMAAPPVHANANAKRDPESTRKLVGWIVYGLLFGIGALLLFALLILAPLFEDDPASQYYYMGIGALWALPLLLAIGLHTAAAQPSAHIRQSGPRNAWRSRP